MGSENIDWDEIESLVSNLVKKIHNLPRTFSSITTISRGGLIPSRLIADQLDIKTIHVDMQKISSDSLFVDDIFDSGQTFDNVICNVDTPSNFVFATLFARTGKKYPSQLIYAKKTLNQNYVVFPWDKFEFTRNNS